MTWRQFQEIDLETISLLIAHERVSPKFDPWLASYKLIQVIIGMFATPPLPSEVYPWLEDPKQPTEDEKRQQRMALAALQKKAKAAYQEQLASTKK